MKVQNLGRFLLGGYCLTIPLVEYFRLLVATEATDITLLSLILTGVMVAAGALILSDRRPGYYLMLSGLLGYVAMAIVIFGMDESLYRFSSITRNLIALSIVGYITYNYRTSDWVAFYRKPEHLRWKYAASGLVLLAAMPGLPVDAQVSMHNVSSQSINPHAVADQLQLSGPDLFNTEYFKEHFSSDERAAISQEYNEYIAEKPDLMLPERPAELQLNNPFINSDYEYATAAYNSNFIEELGLSGRDYISAADLTSAYIASRASGTDPAVSNSDQSLSGGEGQTSDPYALADFEVEMIDEIGRQQSISGENLPGQRQSQANQFQEMETLLQNPDVLDIMDQYFPITGFQRGMTMTELNRLQYDSLRSEFASANDEMLKTYLYGVDYQIYNLADMKGKYADPQSISGTLLAQYPVIESNKLGNLLEDAIVFRRELIDELRRRGAL